MVSLSPEAIMEGAGTFRKSPGSEHCVTPLDPLPSALRHQQGLPRFERASKFFPAPQAGRQQ